MTDLSLVLADLKRDEGRRDRPYRDTRGLLTVGYGHNLDATGLCEAALLAQLQFDVDRAIQSLNIRFPWWASQPAAAQRVLINLCYNMGIGVLATFPVTLAHLQAHEYPAAATSLLQSKYASEVGQRANRLADLLRGILVGPTG